MIPCKQFTSILPPFPPPRPLIRRQPPHHLCHLPIAIDPESLLPRHARQLHVLRIQLLLHDLLQRLEHHCFGFR